MRRSLLLVPDAVNRFLPWNRTTYIHIGVRRYDATPVLEFHVHEQLGAL